MVLLPAMPSASEAGRALAECWHCLEACCIFYFPMVLNFLSVFLRQEARHVVQLWCSCLSVPPTPSSGF